MRRLVQKTLTEVERSLGFQRVWIENPNNRFGKDPLGEPHVIQAIAHKVSNSVWIFKMAWPTGQVYYNEMQYGLTPNAGQIYADWQNVRVSNWNEPDIAIRAAMHLPRDIERRPVQPPVVIPDGEPRQILFDAALVQQSDIDSDEGTPLMYEGRERVAFPVRSVEA